MNDKTKQKFTGQLLYVILTLVVLFIVCIAIAVSLTGGQEAQTTLPPITQAPITTEPPSSGQVSAPLSFSVPVAGELCRLHDTEKLVFCPTMEDYRTHVGIDVSANIGTAVCAVADGVVRHIYTDPWMGVTVVMDHGDGLQSVYQNLSETLAQGVVEGVFLLGGDPLGAIGETAASEIALSPHLHFEMRKNDVQIDPLEYITYDKQVGNYED